MATPAQANMGTKAPNLLMETITPKDVNTLTIHFMDHFRDSVVALIAETINHSMETHED